MYLQTELTIKIPDNLVVIDKVTYNQLRQQELLGRCWTMKDLEQRVGKKEVWIKENILYPARFRRQLDINDGGFVYYPEAKGEKWSFLASKMSQFLDDNFAAIHKKK